MKHYTGLDVSVKETAICIVDETGKICREVKVPSHPDDLIAVLRDPAWNFERVGLEAGPLSQWLFEALARAGLPVICIETRHVKAFLKAQPNKTDRNDARGIAQMMRVNLYRPVHVKTLTSQKRRALLTARKLLQGKASAMQKIGTFILEIVKRTDKAKGFEVLPRRWVVNRCTMLLEMVISLGDFGPAGLRAGEPGK
ncbi:MAG: hypothetical protein EOS44_15660 [Mesorhizobium sp.]|nr:MAG: hypothetical protein EOS44_15660 [Mesorhizobium sp.]